ncbi:MAG: D-hexose-6-phosphate mutarotase [Gammaproteobacteria bacterium]|nr:D-hexose-6-phosphate mutarotase [Gammaproteobacteria bacterium]MCP5298718.1 D-hexose-6-phosphate mutarotase [Chromatiaceae bacterium]
MSVEDLNQAFAIAGVAEFARGPGGLPQLNVTNSSAQAVISLHGGQVLSFVPRSSGTDLLFLSTRAHYAVDKAIKGGIPLCWPWFGADPEKRGRPAHGFARTSAWSVQSVSASGPGHTQVVLELRDDATTRALWPHRFELELVIEVSDELSVALHTRNTGDATFPVTQALHTYFGVGQIDTVTVTGLEGLAYLDKVQGFSEHCQGGPVTFAGEVDRIYQGVAGDLQIHDQTRGRIVQISAGNSHTAVVWNPWSAVNATMSDLEPEDFRRFVCVETANAGNEIICVAPGAACSLSARYRVAP